VPWAALVCCVGLFAVATIAATTMPESVDLAPLTASDLTWQTSWLVIAAVGAVVASRRPENPIGWLFLAGGFVQLLSAAAQQYATWGLVRHPGSLPFGAVVAWATTLLWLPPIVCAIVAVALFPNGRLLSRRWRWIVAAMVVVATVLILLIAVDLWSVRGPLVLSSQQDQSFLDGRLSGMALTIGYPVLLAFGLAAMTSPFLRYRRASGVERQQLRWLALTASVALVAIGVSQLPPVQAHPTLTDVLGYFDMPGWFAAAAGVAILRYRLYDIDRIISRTASYALLTGVLAAVYVGMVTGVSHISPARSTLGVAASTVVVALLFNPLRRRMQAVVDRRFNRARYDAGRTVEAFAARLRDEIDLDHLSRDVVSVVARTVEPSSVSLWLREPSRSG
jgi:hypothetical protein